MYVIRLVVLSILLYICWILIRGIMSRKSTNDRGDGSGNSEENTPSQDTLVEDPVCHTLVPKHQAIRFRKDGETYYFCSDSCCDKFSESGRGEE